MKTLTFAIPFLNEYDNLINFPHRMKELENSLSAHCFFLFVDDGSFDASLSLIQSWNQKNVGYLSLSKNYGSHLAIFAALDHCTSDYFTFMSADMQEPITLYIDMLQTIEKTQTDIVLALREARKDSIGNVIFSKVYNFLVRLLAFPDFPKNGVDIVFLNQKVIKTMQEIREKNSSFYGVLFTIGFKKSFVSYTQAPRKIGRSKWTFLKKIKLILDTFISFTVFPLRMISFTGLFFFLTSISYGLYLFVRTIFYGISVPGYVTMVILISGGFGLNFLFLGIFSEYLWRMFDQLRPRPRYIVSEKKLD